VQKEFLEKLSEQVFKSAKKLDDLLGRYDQKWVAFGACAIILISSVVILIFALCFCCEPDDELRVAPKPDMVA
jgi:hypothetical protein